MSSPHLISNVWTRHDTRFSRNSGIFYSVGSSIHSSWLGDKPDPMAVMHQSGGNGGGNGGGDAGGGGGDAGGGVGDVPNVDMNGGDMRGIHSSPIDNWSGETSESGSVLSFLRNSVRRLGLKLGYIKKADPHPDVLHDFQDEDVDLYHEYQCMTADDQPILVNNVPVTVHQPEDCQQYFAQDQTEGYASIMEPPVEFVLAAKTLYKSNDD